MKRVLPFILLILGLFSVTSEIRAQIPGYPNRWNSVTMTDLDTGRVAPAVFTIGGKSYVIGGDTSEYFGAHTRWTRNVWAYTHATNTWSRVADFPGDPRLGAVAFGSTSTGKGYYGLGFDSTGKNDTIFTYNSTRQDIDTIPYYRKRFYKDWWEYDTATNAWTQKNDFPLASHIGTLHTMHLDNGIANASAFSIDTAVKVNGATAKFYAGGFVFGEYWEFSDDSLAAAAAPWPGGKWDGLVKQVFSRTPYFYDPVADDWTAGPICPGPGRSNAVAMILDADQDIPGRNPKLYCGLGDNDAYNIILLNIYLKDWYSYDFATNNWAKERNLPDTGRTTSSGFAFEHVGFIVGGFDGEWSKRFFVYNTNDGDWQRYPDYRDSGRSLGASFAHGNRGYYGAGFRGLSEELETFSWWTIDTSTIRVKSHYTAGDTFCAGSDVTVDWWTGFGFTPGASMQMQVSDENGDFEWPITEKSDMGTFTITGMTDTVTGTLPRTLNRGGLYRTRLISSSPFYISRLSDTFFVKENITFTYAPKIHPLIDTVCVNADYFIPIVARGGIDSVGVLSYQWLKDGNPVSGAINDTFYFTQTQFSDEGIYRVIVQGDCLPDTSLEFSIGVENTPPPVITDNLNYPGQVGKVLELCEYDSNTFYIHATGKEIRYQWYWNGQPLDQRDNIQGLGSRFIFNLAWQMADSGSYKVRAIESCGAYTESDSIIVKMRDIPRVTFDPINIYPPVLEGTDIEFACDATGYALQFQWRKDDVHMVNTGRITGTDAKILKINDVIPEDVAFYSCIVSGGCPGFADTTNLAILDLNAAPTIEKQPVDTLELCEGQSNVISIIAAGTNLNYRWHWAPLDTGALLPPMFTGADTRILRINGAQAGYTGFLRCEVDNGKGISTFTSLTYFRVKPNPPKPTITKSGTLLVASASCETYIWFMNGVWKPQYATKTIKPTEEGDYTVRVLCDECPSEISDPVYMQVISGVATVNNKDLQIYPNPGTSQVMIDLPGISEINPARVNVYDLSGKLILSYDGIKEDSYELNIEALSKGMYLVVVTSAETTYSGKLIKE